MKGNIAAKNLQQAIADYQKSLAHIGSAEELESILSILEFFMQATSHMQPMDVFATSATPVGRAMTALAEIHGQSPTLLKLILTSILGAELERELKTANTDSWI